jgi:hypothetical protein
MGVVGHNARERKLRKTPADACHTHDSLTAI